MESFGLNHNRIPGFCLSFFPIRYDSAMSSAQCSKSKAFKTFRKTEETSVVGDIFKFVDFDPHLILTCISDEAKMSAKVFDSSAPFRWETLPKISGKSTS